MIAAVCCPALPATGDDCVGCNSARAATGVALPATSGDCGGCGVTYRVECQTVWDEQEVQAYRIECETQYEQRQVTRYAPQWFTEQRERRYTALRPVRETTGPRGAIRRPPTGLGNERPQSLLRPRPRGCRNLRAGRAVLRIAARLGDSGREERYVVRRPVWETAERTQCRTVVEPHTTLPHGLRRSRLLAGSGRVRPGSESERASPGCRRPVSPIR